MSIVEHNSTSSLIEIATRATQDGEWGATTVRREYLRVMTNEAFILAVNPALQGSDEAHVALNSDQMIYILWRGKPKTVYKLLRNLISASLMRAGLSVDSSVLVTFIDPITRADELRQLLMEDKSTNKTEDEDDDDHDDDDNALQPGASLLRASQEQIALFQEANLQKPYRRQLHMLVVEDQGFSQKLLCEILRSVRIHNNNESPMIDTVATLREAWKIFLKKAPDITFVDLNLPDGSGHALARAIKEVDPFSQVNVVTANNYEEELNVARQNNVDGFIAKPYNKKQIMDCVERYIGQSKSSRNSWRGHTGQFR